MKNNFLILAFYFLMMTLVHSNDDGALGLRLIRVEKESLTFEVSCGSVDPILVADPEKCGADIEVVKNGVFSAVSSSNHSPSPWKHVIILSKPREGPPSDGKAQFTVSFNEAHNRSITRMIFTKDTVMTMGLRVSNAKSFAQESLGSFKVRRITVSIDSAIKK